MRGEGRWGMCDPGLATLLASERLGCSGGAPVMEGSAVDHQTLQPPSSSPFLCCLAASDVWACREVPEWALERGHSLPVPPALTHM